MFASRLDFRYKGRSWIDRPWPPTLTTNKSPTPICNSSCHSIDWNHSFTLWYLVWEKRLAQLSHTTCTTKLGTISSRVTPKRPLLFLSFSMNMVLIALSQILTARLFEEFFNTQENRSLWCGFCDAEDVMVGCRSSFDSSALVLRPPPLGRVSSQYYLVWWGLFYKELFKYVATTNWGSPSTLFSGVKVRVVYQKNFEFVNSFIMSMSNFEPCLVSMFC